MSFSGSPVSALERSLSCCCLAKTLLQLDGVRRVSITDPSGEAARVFADGDIQLTDTGMLPQQETVKLYLPDEQVLLLLDEAPSADVLAGFGYYLLTDAVMHRTYVHPHRREFGPYAAKRA